MRRFGELGLLLAAGLLVSLAAAEDRVVWNLEPTKDHPRSSEGAFVTLKTGRILFYYTQFYGGPGDESAARIAGVFSDDGGRTWSAPRTVLENEGGDNTMSVSLLRLKSGKIAFFYLRKNSWIDCRPYMRVSADEGATWSPPRLVVEAPGYFVLNNDRVIQTASGRLIVPVEFHRSRAGDPESERSFDGRGIALWYWSDDEGAAWHESETWWALPLHGHAGLQESGVVELAGGKLWSWARTDEGSQYGFGSSDGGKTWGAPVPTSLISPLSPASIKPLPGSADLLAVYNDHSGAFPFVRGKRTPLVTAISSDGGLTWPRRKVIEADPDGWYCYTAIHFTDRAVLLGYSAGDSKIGGLNRLRIRRIDLADLKALPAAPAEAGFVPIFDGKTLTGWHPSAESWHGTGKGWRVEDGVITGSQSPARNGGILLTDAEYGDFEVVLEMRNDFGPDSGLFLRSTEKGKAYQAFIDYHSDACLMGVYGEGFDPSFEESNFRFIGSPVKVKPWSSIFALPVTPEYWSDFWDPGRWNVLRARITGNPPTIDTWINGVKFMHWKGADKALPDRGRIGLQVHGGNFPAGLDLTKLFVRYRNIRVKVLDPPKK